MKKHILVFLLSISLPFTLPAQESAGSKPAEPSGAPIPQWLLGDWATRTEGTGTWITDNSAYKSEQEPFDAYGLQWEYGLGGKHLKGRLFCLRDGKDIQTAWQFLEYWDPAAGEVRIVQLGSDGTVGQGRLWQMDDGSIKEQQKFTRPGGGTFESGHHIWMENGENHTQSFTIEDGMWVKRRYYVWESEAEQAKGNSQVTLDSIFAPSLSSNLLNEPPLRKVYVFLPPGYHEAANRRYPVLYLLHAYNNGPRSWLGENGYEGLNVAAVLDSLITEGAVGPMIVVMPDASTKLGGSWYVNSTTGGNWTDFIAEDLVNFIDSKYRTLAGREARWIAGQSMGGYGALYIAIARPDVFSAVAGISPVNLVNPDPFGTPAHEEALKLDIADAETGHIFGRLFWSKAIAFSPGPDSPPFFASLPVFKEGGAVQRDQKIWEQWMSYALINRVEERKEALAQLKIMISIGNKDPLIKESKAFSDILTANEIEHNFVIFEGGHVSGVRKHFSSSVFRFFTE